IKTNIDELIVKEAVVIKEIEPYIAGEVKLDGKEWRAVSESKQVYKVDEVVVVLRIEGVTIITK
ncbi:MAG: NfeD family protein, partial [Turicibacter sp.]|nr:NfeD family protein [Turicibacter sp.]